MAEISTTAPLKLEAKKKFTGQVLDHKEFADESGLDWYEFKYRRMDPQIGRFMQIDPLAAKYPYNSTYAYAENRVVDGIDLEGLEYVRFGKYPYNGSAWDYLKAIPNAATDIVQSVVDATWNSGVANYQSIQNGTWGKDIVNDLKGSGKAIKNFGINSFNYTVNTPILQQLDDAARPQSLEVGLSILGTAALTKSLPKVEVRVPKISTINETTTNSIYRVVSKGEAEDVFKNGFRQAPIRSGISSYEGKLFWTNMDDAKWYKNWVGDDNQILKLNVNKDFIFQNGTDAGRQFYYVSPERLNQFNSAIKFIR